MNARYSPLQGDPSPGMPPEELWGTKQAKTGKGRGQAAIRRRQLRRAAKARGMRLKDFLRKHAGHATDSK